MRYPDADGSAAPAIKLYQNALGINYDWALFNGSNPASPEQRNICSPAP